MQEVFIYSLIGMVFAGFMYAVVEGHSRTDNPIQTLILITLFWPFVLSMFIFLFIFQGKK